MLIKVLKAVEDEMYLKQCVRDETGCCTYLIGNSDECVIVDPLTDYHRFIPKDLLDHKPSIKYVIDTHIHADHLSGARSLSLLTGAKLMMHESTSVSFDYSGLKDGEEIDACGVKIKVLHTPGHATEHVSLLVDGESILTGDSLLVRDVGRTDLGRGNNEQMYQSLSGKLMLLDDSTKVYPGHVGAKHFVSGQTSSTIGEERRLNPALQLKSLEEFTEYMTVGWPPKPPNYQKYIGINSGKISLDDAIRE